jgi:hypothetical protein
VLLWKTLFPTGAIQFQQRDGFQLAIVGNRRRAPVAAGSLTCHAHRQVACSMGRRFVAPRLQEIIAVCAPKPLSELYSVSGSIDNQFCRTTLLDSE